MTIGLWVFVAVWLIMQGVFLSFDVPDTGSAQRSLTLYALGLSFLVTALIIELTHRNRTP